MSLSHQKRNRILSTFPLLVGSILLTQATGCATDVSETESGLEIPKEAEAQLNRFQLQDLPSSRPFQVPGIYAGEQRVEGRILGHEWSLLFAPGPDTPIDTAQVVNMGNSNEEDSAVLDLLWNTKEYAEAARAGEDPETDDLYSLYLRSDILDPDGGWNSSVDRILVKLDNTPPVAILTRICFDREGTQCLGLDVDTSAVDTTTSEQRLLEFSVQETPEIYVFGIAIDKNFSDYSLQMVGGESTEPTFLCSGSITSNLDCVGTPAEEAEPFGYGNARDLVNKETLNEDNLVLAYSSDTLLMAWDISYLLADAYALKLQVDSISFEMDRDYPVASASWVTLLISE